MDKEHWHRLIDADNRVLWLYPNWNLIKEDKHDIMVEVCDIRFSLDKRIYIAMEDVQRARRIACERIIMSFDLNDAAKVLLANPEYDLKAEESP